MRFKVGKMVIFVLFLQNNRFLYVLVVKKKGIYRRLNCPIKPNYLLLGLFLWFLTFNPLPKMQWLLY